MTALAARLGRPVLALDHGRREGTACRGGFILLFLIGVAISLLAHPGAGLGIMIVAALAFLQFLALQYRGALLRWSFDGRGSSRSTVALAQIDAASSSKAAATRRPSWRASTPSS
jgi:hypothetical protein